MKAELLWIVAGLPLLLTAVSELPAPSSLTVSLDDSGYMLRWEPGPGTPAEARFSVHVSSRRQPPLPVSGCQQVQIPLICNLTEAFKELTGTHGIGVKAHLESRVSQPAQLEHFKPITLLPLPRMNVSVCGAIICVHYLPPFRRLRESYNGIEYELRVDSRGQDRPQVRMHRFLESQNVTDVAPGREYCLSVRFRDDVRRLSSNFSQPTCVTVPSNASAAGAVSAFVVSLSVVMLVAVVVALLIFTSFISPKQSRLPSVLTSIRHLETGASSWKASLFSLQNVWMMAPPAGKSGSSNSEETDEESCSDASARNSLQADYTLRPGANPLSSSSSTSSASLSAPPKAEAPPTSCSNQMENDSGVLVVLENQNPQIPDGVIGRRMEEEEEEEEDEVGNVGETVGQEVNLLTLTFGQPEEEENEEQEEDCPDVPEELNLLTPPLVRPSQPDAVGASSSSTEEEEEEEGFEDGGYMCRVPAAVS